MEINELNNRISDLNSISGKIMSATEVLRCALKECGLNKSKASAMLEISIDSIETTHDNLNEVITAITNTVTSNEVRGELTDVRNIEDEADLVIKDDVVVKDRKGVSDAKRLADTIQPNQLIADRIRERRTELGITPEALAATLGLIPADITSWESYSWNIDAEYIPALATALQCDPMWLMVGEPLPPIISNHPIKVTTDADWKGFGKRLKAFREEQGITPDQLTSYLNVRPTDVIAWEQGSMPASELIDHIAKAIGCRTMWLVTGKGDPEIETTVEH